MLKVYQVQQEGRIRNINDGLQRRQLIASFTFVSDEAMEALLQLNRVTFCLIINYVSYGGKKEKLENQKNFCQY